MPIPSSRRRPSQIQRRTVVKRTRRPHVHVVRPAYPAVVVSLDGKVAVAHTEADAIFAAAQMLLQQGDAEGWDMVLKARVAAVVVTAAAR